MCVCVCHDVSPHIPGYRLYIAPDMNMSERERVRERAKSNRETQREREREREGERESETDRETRTDGEFRAWGLSDKFLRHQALQLPWRDIG